MRSKSRFMTLVLLETRESYLQIRVQSLCTLRGHCRQGHATFSLDHLVGGRQQGRRHRDAERLGGLEAYHEFKFGWLFDGKIARLGAVQNLVNIVTRAAKHLSVIGSIRHQPPAFDVIPGAVHRRQLRCERQGVYANLVGADEWVGGNVKRVHTTLKLIIGGSPITSTHLIQSSPTT